MRFRLLRELRKSDTLRWSQAEKSFKMTSDWRKMKRKGSFTLSFPEHSRFESLKYKWYSQDGEERGSFTSATILRWQQRAMREHGEKTWFSPTGTTEPTQAQFQAWLRLSFAMLLMLPTEERNALVNAITPHSFRAGLASDMEREGVPRPIIMKHGRWTSPKAMTQYARDGLGQRLRAYSFRVIPSSKQLHEAAMLKARTLSRKRKKREESENRRKRVKRS